MVNKVLIGVVAVGVLLIAGAAFFLFSPPGPAVAYAESVPADTRGANAALLGALHNGGIDDPFVDISPAQVYVAYQLPQGFDSTVMQRYVIGASADASPTSSKIISVQYVGGKPKLAWTVQTADFKAYVRGELTVDQFEAKIQKQNF